MRRLHPVEVQAVSSSIIVLISSSQNDNYTPLSATIRLQSNQLCSSVRQSRLDSSEHISDLFHAILSFDHRELTLGSLSDFSNFRPIEPQQRSPSLPLLACLFKSPFHIFVSVQVSVAVLIDKFVSASAMIKFEANEAKLAERKKREVRFSVGLRCFCLTQAAFLRAGAAGLVGIDWLR